MNDDDRLTPEERNLIEAALALHDARGLDVAWCEKKLVHAADDYRKATAPPEPFDAYVGFGGDVHLYGKWNVTDELHHLDPRRESVWRCTVTPIERVRR